MLQTVHCSGIPEDKGKSFMKDLKISNKRGIGFHLYGKVNFHIDQDTVYVAILGT